MNKGKWKYKEICYDIIDMANPMNVGIKRVSIKVKQIKSSNDEGMKLVTKRNQALKKNT